MGRVQKLLRAEFQDLVANERLIVESPFAETTRDGRGLREVALGLTASKLIVAKDNLGDNRIFWCPRNVDPSIESLELVSVYPLEYLTLTVFRERKRKALEARLIDGRAKYYELGGLGCRARSWNDWCHQVRRLLEERNCDNKRRQSCGGWTRKHLYLGPDYEELWDEHYTPKPVAFARANLQTVKDDLISPRSTSKIKNTPPPRLNKSEKVVRRVSRFAQGVDEKCQHALYIQVEQSDSQLLTEVTKECTRRIFPTAHFLRGLGPWTIQPGDRVSLQSRLTQSLANIRRQDPELRLPVSKRHLTRATASLASLDAQLSTTRSVLLFWTTDYWYRPRAAREVYRDVRRHLDEMRLEDCRRTCYRRSTTYHLRRLLKLHHSININDISSTTLYRQLTLIDRELFGRITVNEVRALARHRDSREAPNFAAWVAFAHRVTCLLESQVVKVEDLVGRSRIVRRLIRAAEKCVEEGSFQSANSIVAALQSPAVYRLKATWAYLESHHAIKYNTMTKLSKLFASTRTRHYHEAWITAENDCRASIPCVDDVLTRIIGFQQVERKLDGDWKLMGIDWFRLGCQKQRKEANEIDQVIVWLETCQSRALNYDYPCEPLAWEFLLKARYLEDRENFLWSFIVEASSG